jgi:ADP-heptose:LPS heptosyltransferase
MKLLLQFFHGLGDCVQFTVVLKHLKHYYPDCVIGIVANMGRENVFFGLADKVWPRCHPKYWEFEKWDKELLIKFSCPSYNFIGASTSKISQCLVEEFNLQPIPELFQYTMMESEENGASLFLKDCPRPFSIVHGHSEASGEDKHLTENEILAIAEKLLNEGTTPVFFDFAQKLKSHWNDPRFRFLDRRLPIWGKDELNRNGNAQVLRGIIKEAKEVYAIDSGPSHVAATTTTPTHVFWRGTNPSYCFDPCGNVTHYLPTDWEARYYHKEHKEQAIAFFKQNYRFETYGDDLLSFLKSKR